MMDEKDALSTLRELHAELCTLVGRGEGLWYHEASDYQSSYSFTDAYDKPTKHRYYAKADACREKAAQLKQFPFPSNPKGIVSFVNRVREHLKEYPHHRETQRSITAILERMEEISSLAMPE